MGLETTPKQAIQIKVHILYIKYKTVTVKTECERYYCMSFLKLNTTFSL